MATKGLHLYQKMMLILLVVIIPICVISIRSNHLQQETVLREITDAQLAKLSFYGMSIAQEIDRLQKNTYTCVNDSDFIKLSVFWDVLTDYERTEAINHARKTLKLLRNMSPYAANISIYMPSMGRKVNAINCDFEVTEDEMKMLLNRDSQAGLLTVHGENIYVCSIYPAGQQLKLNPSLLMAIEVDQSCIIDVLRTMVPSDESDVFILGERWCLSAASGEEEWEMRALYQTIAELREEQGSLTPVNRHGVASTLNWEYCPSIGAYIASCIPQEIILAPLQQANKWISLLLGIAVVMTALAVIWEYRTIHLPMKQLVYAFEQVEAGNYDIQLQTRKRDEFDYLYNSFNHMVETIKELFDQVYKQKILSQQAQLKQLQTQINPHFFYNSFFTIQGMLDMGEYDSAAQMLGTLGQYFQFITRSGSEFVSLQREVAHAYAYCEVQQIRFRSIRVRFDPFEEELVGMRVPRLILQPLIENAYVHGLENVMEGELHVWAEQQGAHLLIHVDNTGMSITQEELTELQQKLDATEDESMEVTGLINIHRRLKLYYGADCGLRISKSTDGTTQVTLILRLEEKKNVQNFGC